MFGKEVEVVIEFRECRGVCPLDDIKKSKGEGQLVEIAKINIDIHKNNEEEEREIREEKE